MQCDFKIVLLGSTYVGKTSIVTRFVEQKFFDRNRYNSTIGAAFIAKRMTSSSGKNLLLGIWDTAGEERFEAVSRTFYRNANAAIVCFDVSIERSWERAKKWISELRQFEENCKIYLCATKIDLIKSNELERKVSEDKTIFYVTGVGIKYYETSSRTGENIEELFQTIADDYLNEKEQEERISKSLINLTKSPNKTCCFF